VDKTSTEQSYRVVVNDEDQYSIWPDGQQAPDGWHDAGHSGAKADCLRYIELNWTDMRPRSIRNTP